MKGFRGLKIKLICFSVLLASSILLSLAWKGTREVKTVKIAMGQIFSLDGDREGNFTRMEHGIREAKEGGSRLVCFPETAILGWVNPAAHERAHPIPGEDSDRLCALAKKHGIYLCVGLAEKEGDKLYDASVLINDEGRILLKHRKINILTELMTPPYTKGRDVSVVETPFGRVGLLICADTFKEELLERMAALEPDLLLVPYGWAASEHQWPEHGKALEKVVKHAAIATGAAVIGTDLVGVITNGPWRGLVYGGQSVAVDRSGILFARAEDRDRDIKIIELAIE